MADDTIADRLAHIEANMAAKADLAILVTKADLAEAIAGVAKNVDIQALGQQVERLMLHNRATRADLQLLINSVQALLGHQMALASRLDTLENPPV